MVFVTVIKTPLAISAAGMCLIEVDCIQLRLWSQTKKFLF